VAIQVTSATETTESEVALEQVQALDHQHNNVKSVGGDKNYHNKRFVSGCRQMGVAPHTAQLKGRKVAGLDGRTTRAKGYQASQKARKRIESIFGWMKTTGGLRRSRHRGIERTNLQTTIVATAYNIVRLAKLRTAT
jgi:IS5 family transposase